MGLIHRNASTPAAITANGVGASMFVCGPCFGRLSDLSEAGSVVLKSYLGCRRMGRPMDVDLPQEFAGHDQGAVAREYGGDSLLSLPDLHDPDLGLGWMGRKFKP
jgi:hypothetical protein